VIELFQPLAAEVTEPRICARGPRTECAHRTTTVGADASCTDRHICALVAFDAPIAGSGADPSRSWVRYPRQNGQSVRGATRDALMIATLDVTFRASRKCRRDVVLSRRSVGVGIEQNADSGRA
jgi:hypothetical protein